MKSKILGLFLTISFLLSAQNVSACGFYETEADYQAMMFRAMLPNMKCLFPFHYTTSGNYYTETGWWYDDFTTDIAQNDPYRNCSEWLAVCDKSVLIHDIADIQYRTDGNMFIKSYLENSLTADFKNNSFIAFLAKKENKELLDYMLFAKKMELTEMYSHGRFENWWEDKKSDRWRSTYYYEYGKMPNEAGAEKSELLKIAKEKLNKTSSPFLKQRYAFQVCRLKYQLKETDDILQTFTQYFGKIDPNSLMSIWAGFFTGMSLTGNERHKLLIQAFSYSDSKKLRCVELFDNNYNPDFLTKSEHSMAIVMNTLRNPGRVVDQIHKAYSLDKNNKYIPFLILREVNKLEDWMVTPLLYKKYAISFTDIFTCDYKYSVYEDWFYNSDIQKLRLENIKEDKAYLNELKSLLIKILPQSSGEVKDFYSICLAHLCLLQENAAEANKYLSMVSNKANPTIKLQQKLETIWLATKTQNIHSERFKDIFIKNISDLEKISSPQYDNKIILYTLTMSLANEYFKKNDRVYGNLMRMKSDRYRGGGYFSYVEEYYSQYSYPLIEYFDYNATTSDMTQLINLLEKKDKTDFEKYLCNQPLASVNAYKDLKGTIAFRNNDLQLAYETFSSLPEDYWQKSNGLSFSDYLNENPFEAKGLREEKHRKFDYKFNKAAFVKQLIDLQKQAETDSDNRMDCYIKLGNAYFNTSCFGNSWMMTRYRLGISYDYYADKMEYLPQWYKDYRTAAVARQYFEIVLKEAKNNEQRAYAALMLYQINRSIYYAGQGKNYMDLAKQYCQQFLQYNETKTFGMYECPGMKEFLLEGIAKK